MLIMLKGFQTELTEIDDHLALLPALKQAVVIVYRSSMPQQDLTLHIALPMLTVIIIIIIIKRV